MTILEAKGLNKRFGGLIATRGVDLDVHDGEILGLIGPNGAGKTTLFNLLSGALRVDSGVIRFKGQDITDLKPHQIARKGIARTFQSVKIFSRISVFNHVRLGCLFGKPQPRGGAGADRTIDEILEFVGLSSMRDTRGADLILANQKRLEIARALGTGPEILLLDELMAGLNPSEVAEAMDLVKRIRDRGVTLLVIEHVMKAIMNICDRIAVLHHGEKIAEGKPEEIAGNQKVIEVYFGETASAVPDQPSRLPQGRQV
ncbi:MAG: ABC transporter ATP-binding protein [Deltaproteobacteria bacterium HGW-Deltaproteobacteria-21]|jgi:branched-chain amino acid transport system ATP-binding protein|nr:MAG: ABC transporter ATP-binding protein [Deltaproteobacteria bacterium HGW-Deltaproteobacteria-21]